MQKTQKKMNKIQKKRFHLRANKAMKKLVKTMLHAEDRLELKEAQGLYFGYTKIIF